MTAVNLPGAASTERGAPEVGPLARPPLRRVSSTLRHAWHRESGKPEFDTEAIAQGQVPSRRLLMIGRVPAPADIAAWLGVAAGEEVMVRKRLQFLDGVPAVIS